MRGQQAADDIIGKIALDLSWAEYGDYMPTDNGKKVDDHVAIQVRDYTLQPGKTITDEDMERFVDVWKKYRSSGVLMWIYTDMKKGEKTTIVIRYGILFAM